MPPEPPSASVTWIALPGGTDESTVPPQAKLSVFVAPRLSGDGSLTLADFPPFTNWATAVAGAAFAVEVDGGPTVPAQPVGDRPDPALWSAVFAPSTPVLPRVFDDAGVMQRRPATYNQRKVFGGLHSGYTGTYHSSPVGTPTRRQQLQAFPALAAALSTVPRPLVAPGSDPAALEHAAAAVAEDLLGHALRGSLDAAVSHARGIAARLAAGRPRGARTPLIPATDTVGAEIGRLLAFHHVPSGARSAIPLPATPLAATPLAATPPDPVAADFHAMLTALADYPVLLRRLGLVVDLRVPLGELPASALTGTSPQRLRVVPPPLGAPLVTRTVTPWTAYVRDGAVFSAAPAQPAAPETVGGLMNLALPDYDVFQVDLDGGAIKAVNAAAGTSDDPDDDAALPSLRTTGLTLSRNEQEQALEARMAAALATENAAFSDTGEPPTLFAEDLTRGMRVDVLDATTGSWASLHARVGTYTVGRGTVGGGTVGGGTGGGGTAGDGSLVVDAADEGSVQPAASHLPDGSTGDGLTGEADLSALLIHEALARWEGWSLSVPPPGASVTDDGGLARIASAPAAGGLPVTASFAVQPGTLPRLRYGRHYRLRARAVDLGGAGPTSAEADSLLAQLAAIGAAAPVLPRTGEQLAFRRFEPVTGPVAVLTEVVTEGEAVDRLVIRSDRGEDAAACGLRLTTLVRASRPAAGLRYLATAQRHLAPPKAAQREVERAGMLDGLVPEASYALSRKEKGRLGDAAVVDIATGLEVSLPATDDVDPVTGVKGTRPAVELVQSGDTSYPLDHEPQLTLPYLPDPFAAGAVLCGLPGLADHYEAAVDATGTLVISKSGLDPAALDIVGKSVATIDYQGTWPLLRPFRLSLASGSAPPAWDPSARVLTVSLPPGGTATVRISSSLHPGALDLLGIWQWVLEDHAARGVPPPALGELDLALRGLTWMLTPFRQLTLVHAVQRPLLDPGITSMAAVRTAGDTGASLEAGIAVDVASTSKIDLLATWSETIDDPTRPGPRVVTTQAHVLDVPIPPPADLGQLAGGVLQLGTTGPGTGRSRQEFGDTRHRRISYQAVATTAFGEYFPPEVDPADTVASGQPVVVEVPSSARPPAPVLRAALPSYRWDRPADPTLPRRRHAAGVRLLLDRPWFASGEGELLAVVLADPAAYPASDTFPPNVTHWGGDPIWAADTVPGPPTTARFPAAVATVDGVTLPEVGAVSIAAHAVVFDADRGVWVCDIPVDVGTAYMPFIRLAVARYQPVSVPGLALSLSPVVVVPFVQVLPDRAVTVTPPTAAAPDTFGVRVDGVTYAASALPPPPPAPSSWGDPDSGEAAVVVSDLQGLLPAPPLVDVVVQQRLPGTTDEAGWRPAPDYLEARVSSTSMVSGLGIGTGPAVPLWTGAVTLPADRSPGQYRIVVTESQLLLSDAEHWFTWTELDYHPGDLPNDPPRPQPQHRRATYRPGTQRLVFAETIEV